MSVSLSVSANPRQHLSDYKSLYSKRADWEIHPNGRCHRHLIRVASYFNGWYGIFVVGERAVGTRHTAADSRVPKGTLSLHLLDPAILGRAKRQSRAEMAGYHYHAPTGPVELSHRPRSTFGRLPLGPKGRLPEQEGKKLFLYHF